MGQNPSFPLENGMPPSLQELVFFLTHDDPVYKRARLTSNSSSSSSSSSCSSSCKKAASIIDLTDVNILQNERPEDESEVVVIVPASSSSSSSSSSYNIDKDFQLAQQLQEEIDLQVAQDLRSQYQSPQKRAKAKSGYGFGVVQLAPGDSKYKLVYGKLVESGHIRPKHVKIFAVEANAKAQAAFDVSKRRYSSQLLWHGTTQSTSCRFGRMGKDLAGPCRGLGCNVCSIIRQSFQQGYSRKGTHKKHKREIFFSSRSGYRYM